MPPLSPETAARRYEALDSLRGLCALIVAVFHFASSTNAHVPLFFVNGWLFVDFFFVLSGFVIATSYGERLAQGFSPARFMALRFGRIYPLHVAVLGAMLALEVAGLVFGLQGAAGRAAFEEGKSLPALFGSLGLIHIFGIWPHLVWNGPSWSIAAEMWAYAVFAAVWRFAGRARLAVMLGLSAAGLASLAAWGDPWLGQAYTMVLPRCLFGFGLGVLAHSLHARGIGAVAGTACATLLEAAVVAICVAFVALTAAGPLTLIAPLVFLAGVLVFAGEGGLVSSLLRLAPLRLLGRFSYSIYMVHVLLLGLLVNAAKLVQGRLGVELVDGCAALPGLACFRGDGVAGLVMPPLYLALLLVAAYVSWRLVEEPGRRLSRRLITPWRPGVPEPDTGR